MSDYFDPGFDPEAAAKGVVEWVKEWFDENGKGCNAVIGISGGKDSSVTSAVCCEALGADRVIGVMLPNTRDGEHADLTDGRKLIEHLGIRSYVINIRESYDAIIKELGSELEGPPSEQTIINLPPRLRMTALYAVSQSNNGRVANTGNLSEDWVGYSTRYGDSAGDFSPLSNFTVQEVKAIGMVLGLPGELVNRIPDDGLSGMSDEEKLGFTYDELDRYIRTGEISDQVTKEKIDRLHKLNLFKLQLIPAYKTDAPVCAR